MEPTKIWELYQAGKDHHNRESMYTKVEKFHRFYEGDQWAGIKSGGEELPILNFIKPICRYQIATVAMNEMAVVFTSLSGDPETQALCDALTKFAAVQAEKTKLDSQKWSVVKNACITGDHYLYCFDRRTPSGSVAGNKTPALRHRLVSKEDVYLSNEQEPELGAQEWIIVAERIPVSKARQIAEQNKLPVSEIEQIVSDEELETGDRPDREVKYGGGKCTSLLYMELTDQGIKFCRSTKGVVYQPEQTIEGMDVYPLAAMRWEEKHDSARGIGLVERLIPNQIEVNKTLARRSLVVKRYGYPTAVVDARRIRNPEALNSVGATIYADNLQSNPIGHTIQYLAPAPMSGDAAALEAELLTQSRELEGAGNAATGQVDPTKASGEAIKAARDQSAMNLNENTANFKQFMEDMAIIWYKLWVAYSQDGMNVSYPGKDGETEEQLLDGQQLREAELDIRVDVSPADPYSVLAREMALENALAQQHISFEEYVESLDANSSVPKEKFKAILERRAAQAAMQAQAGPEPMPEQGLEGQLPPELMAGLMGGGTDAMPQMQM